MRSAHAELATAEREALDFAAQAMRNFPQEGIFAYGSPRWLDKWDLQHALFQPIDPKPIDKVNKKIFLVEVKYSKNGVAKARAPSSIEPGQRILSWTEEKRAKLASWKALFAQTPEHWPNSI